MPEPTLNPPSNVEESAAADLLLNNQIWMKEEKDILKSHAEGYHTVAPKTKLKFVIDKVIPEFWAYWKGQYNRKKLKKDKNLKQEWAKKKDVFLKCIYINISDQFWSTENFHMVWEPHGVQAGIKDPRVQPQGDLRYSGEYEEETGDPGGGRETIWECKRQHKMAALLSDCKKKCQAETFGGGEK
jgi:hypothetical protein